MKRLHALLATALILSSITPAFAVRRSTKTAQQNAKTSRHVRFADDVEATERQQRKAAGQGGRRTATSQRASARLPRLQRTPSGNLRNPLENKSTADVRHTQRNANRNGVRMNRPGIAQFATRTRPTTDAANKLQNATRDPRRNAMRQSGPVRGIADSATRQRPQTKMTPRNARRDGVRLRQGVKGIADTGTRRRPAGGTATTNTGRNQLARGGKSKYPISGKTMGKAMGGLALGGAAAAALQQNQQLDNDYKAGRISRATYHRGKATQATQTAATLATIKKMNVSGLVMNDLIGTDPISLGAGAVGDLINGTNNTGKTLAGMEDAFNRSLVKQSFTDPKGAVNRVGNDVKKGVKGVGKAVGNAGKFVGGIFKKKKK